jgi:hypothetical protein
MDNGFIYLSKYEELIRDKLFQGFKIGKVYGRTPSQKKATPKGQPS